MMISRLVCGFLLLLGMADGAPARVERPAVERFGGARPIWFEPNRGQVGGRTEWTTRAAGAWLFLTSNEVVYALAPDTSGFDPAKTRGVPAFKTTNVHMRMVGGRRVKGAGEGALGSYSNYFVGKHEDEWFTGVPHFERVRYAEVYPGIDLVYYATGRSVEYDFLVAPGADPASIELAFDGVAGVTVDEAGDLVVSAGGKSFRQHRPRVFQGATEIDAAYRLTERGTVVLDVGEFDPLVSLRVDPVLDFATYLGGPGEDTLVYVEFASDGNPILIGSTQSPASPTLDPFQQPSVVSSAPIILKMSAEGQRVLFYSILGRGGWDMGLGAGVDGGGRLVVVGSTRSPEFPLRNAFQTEFKAIFDSAFVTRLSADGRSLVHSSYMGGSNRDYLRRVTIDDQDNAYLVGAASSNDFPLVQPIQPSFGGSLDGVLAKIALDGRLLQSTFWGGPGADTFDDVTWRSDGMLFAGGSSTLDDFPLISPLFTKPTARTGWSNATFFAIDTISNRILTSTYLGDAFAGYVKALKLDSTGRIYLAGWTIDKTARLVNPLFSEAGDEAFNGFLIALEPNGKKVLWSTFLPGLNHPSLAIDAGAGFIVGGIASRGLATKKSLYDFKGGGLTDSDHGIMRITADGRALAYSTFLGGGGPEGEIHVAIGPSGSVYFVGRTSSLDYVTRVPYQSKSGGSADGVFGRISDASDVQPPVLLLTPPSTSIRYVQGDPLPAPVRISVSNVTQAITISTDVGWLRASPSTISASGNVEITVEPRQLPAGTVRGNVRIGPVVFEVSLTVLAAPPLLSSVEPAMVAVGSTDTELTLRGSGFTGQTQVHVEGTRWLVTPIRLINDATIRFTMPKSYLSSEYNFALAVQNPNSVLSKSISLPVGRPGPAISPGGIVSAASFAGQVISPGEIVTIFGENFEAEMQVSFDGLLATPFYLSAKQLSVTVPYGIAGTREASIVVQKSMERRSVPERVVVWPTRPGLFTATSSGKGQGAVLNQDGSVNSVANPAARGTVVVLYGTGGGALAGNLLELHVKVFIDGIDCEVLYAGVAPGLIPGMVQVNVRVPEFASAGEVVVRVGERESQAGVTVALDPGK